MKNKRIATIVMTWCFNLFTRSTRSNRNNYKATVIAGGPNKAVIEYLYPPQPNSCETAKDSVVEVYLN